MSRKILLDDQEVDWRELIRKASELDYDYKRSTLKQTSVAAEILRSNGHTVEEVYE